MRYLYALGLLVVSLSLGAQTTVTATYTAGNQAADRVFGQVDTSDESSCPLNLTVPVPAGRYITGIDVEYDFESLGFNWQIEQRSYLECITTGLKEATVTNGPNINGAGTASYTRTNLNLANGIVGASGSVQFRLHALKTFGTGCQVNDARINNNTFKITIRHVAAPSCLPPSNIAVASISANSAQLSWTTGGASNWQIEYGAPGFAIGSGTRINATTNPFTLTGLSPSTAYEFVVRDSCGVGNTSFWSNRGNFRTSCSVLSAPYTENFDNGSVWLNSGFASKGDIDTCWLRNYQNNFVWVKGPEQFTSTFSGPSGDHTTGSAQYIFSNWLSFGTAPNTAWIQSPPIDLSSLTAPELRFWYHGFGSGIGAFNAQVSTDGGVNFTSVFTTNGQQQTSQSDPWQEAIISLSSYANDTVIVRFSHTVANFSTRVDFAVDDFSIANAPSCPRPTAFQVDLTWINSVALSYLGSGALGFQVEYGSPGFSLGSGTRTVVTSNNPVISGLSPNTAYEFYVRAICATGDTSIWTTSVSTTTLCSPQTASYFQDFDNANFSSGTGFTALGTIDACFQRSNSNSYIWKTGPSTTNLTQSGPSVDKTSGTSTGKYLMTERISAFGSDSTTTLRLVPVDISGTTNPEVRFWYHMFGANIASLEVYALTSSGRTLLTSLTGQQQTSKGAAWLESATSLSSIGSDTVAIEFVAKRNSLTGFNLRAAIDDILIGSAPTCPRPLNVAVQSLNSSSVTLTWTTSTSALGSIVEYGSPGFTLGSGTQVAVGGSPATITGLSPNTTYEFYVRDSCGATDLSLWSSPLVLTTSCVPIAAPYLEDFEASLWTPATGFTDYGGIDNCWSRDTSQRYVWIPRQGANGTTFSGPDADHTTGSGKYMEAAQVFNFSAAFNREAVLISPQFDLSPLTTPELQFWYHAFGNDIDTLTVEVNDGLGYALVYTLVGQQQTSASAPWTEVNVDLSAYANDTVQFRIGAKRTTTFANNANIAIDDFRLREQPNCPRPSNLSLTSTSSNSASLSWTSGGASNWLIEYGPTGFTQGAGTYVAVNSNPFVLTGLTPGTAYDIYLRDSCGTGDVSDWIGPVKAITACLPVLAPYFENFDGVDFVAPTTFGDSGTFPTCWQRNSNSSRYFWAVGPNSQTTTFTGPAADHTSGSGKYAYTESGFGAVVPLPFRTILTTPPIDLSGLTTPEMSFWYHMFGFGMGDLQVWIDDGSGFTQLFSISGQQQTAQSDPWRERIQSLAAYANDTVIIQFRGVKNSFSTASDMAIDDLRIDETPTCPKPTALASSNPTAFSIQLNWTTGGASNWDIEYGPAGFTPGSGTLLSVSSNPNTVTGLQPNTIYDFYVRDNCGNGDTSEWVGPVTDTTLCGIFSAPYTEDFEQPDFQVAASAFQPGIISPCFSRTSSSTNYFWRVNAGATQSGGTGPNNDHTVGNSSGQYLHMEGFGNSAVSGTLELPIIDISGLTNPEMRYWYHMFGGQVGSLRLEGWNANTSSWQTLSTQTGQQQTSNGAAWAEAVVNLAVLPRDTIALRFVASRGTGFGTAHDISIDDLWIGESPTCTRPTNLTFVSNTTTSIDISWTSGGATNALVKYRPSGSTGPFTIIPSTTATTASITGLQPSTSYEIYVADSCGSGNTSLWLGALLASTQCGIRSLPYLEDFSGGQWITGTGGFNTGDQISACWSRPATTGSRFGSRSGGSLFTTTGPSEGKSGKYLLHVVQGFPNTGSQTIQSEQIDIPTSANAPKLFFWYHMFGADIDSMAVQIQTGTTWSGNVWSKVGQQQTAKTAAWIQDSVDLSTYAGQVIRFRFVSYHSGFFAQMAVDEVEIKEAQLPCSAPTNFSASNISPSGFDLSWSSSNGNTNVIVVPSGQPVGTGTVFTNVTSPFSVSNLNAGTAYDVYIQDSCGIANLSNFLTQTVTTSPCPAVQASANFTRNGLTVNFDASASTAADSLFWDYGDGNSASGQNPTHAYASAGSYNVQLIAFNDCGNSDTLIIFIQVCGPLSASFVIAQTGTTVNFDASASTNASGYLWDFGDGNSGTGQTTSNVYAAAGNYTVDLTVFNACGDTLDTAITFKVCLKPIVSWTYNIISSSGSGMLVQFDATATANATNYSWSFGDGNTANGTAVPQHLYLVPSLNYTVRCIATNDCGGSDTLMYKLNQIGIEEGDVIGLAVQVYPNPSSGMINLKWNSAAALEDILAIDARGSFIPVGALLQRQGDGHYTLDFNQLPAGVYVLRLKLEGQWYQQKVQLLK